MKLVSPRLLWWLFVMSILLLAALGSIVVRRANRYSESEAWVEHSEAVEVDIARVRSAMSIISAARYEAQTDPTALARYQAAADGMNPLIDSLEKQTADNPGQQESIQKLRTVLQQRSQVIARDLPGAPALSAAEKQQDRATEAQLTGAATDLLRTMRAEEQSLLGTRAIVSASQLRILRLALVLAALVVFGTLSFTFRALLAQVSQNEAAERAVRKLSAHILRIQDEERRRLARELHDGVGQIFAGLAMELENLARSPRLDAAHREVINGVTALAQEGLSQTRTLSYLLHPPMLDEFGLEQAATWYVEGFVKRSNVAVDLKFSQPFRRLPDALELVLFRVIQESLTNVHRHSESKRAEIALTLYTDRVALRITDFGKGIAPDLLKSIEVSSSGAGVGLGGMRERVSELGGQLVIDSDAQGTTLAISLPLLFERETESAAAEASTLASREAARAGN